MREAAPKGDWETIRKIDRLETGITWIGILDYLKNIFKYDLTIEVKNILSLVLDYSVDKGICVPVTRHNTESDIVFRAYRHGEDVKFSEEETELCGYAIESAQKQLGEGKIPKLFLEKLLVLLVRIGASNGMLQVQYGTSGQDGIAKIGFYLQGAVVKLKKRNSYNAESNLWLSKHLQEKRVISKVEKNYYTFNRHYPAIQISSTSRIEAQKLGSIFGILFKGVDSGDTKLRLNEDDLVYLSTCFRPRDVAAALLVELEFFIDDFLPLVQQVYDSIDKKRLKKNESYHEMLANRGYKALNSLHKKTIGWHTKGALRAIQKGEEIFDKLGQDIVKLDWEAYWKSIEILKREDEEIVFDEKISSMASLGHRILFNINLLNIVLCFDKGGINSSENKYLHQEVKKINQFYNRSIDISRNFFSEIEHQLIENLKQQVYSNFADFDEQKTLTYIQRKFSELSSELSRVTPIVSTSLEDFEQRGDATIHYDFFVYYDIVDSTATKKIKHSSEIETYRNQIKRIKGGINDLVYQMQKKARQEGDELYCWNGDANSTNDAKYAFFSSEKSGFSFRRVREFLDRLYSFSTSDVSFRAIVCPANVFHTKVFKRFKRTEVEGELFWEHYSRVHKRFKELELKYESCKNLVLIIGNETSPVLSDQLNLKQKVWEGEIETLIAAAYFKTYGELWVPK